MEWVLSAIWLALIAIVFMQFAILAKMFDKREFANSFKGCAFWITGASSMVMSIGGLLHMFASV